MNLGENIYKHRTAKKLSQEDFASAMEVSRQSVSKWENDQAVPELDKLIKMAKLFDISLDELVGNTPPQSTPEPNPAPPPAPGITTGDLISVLLLLLGIILPVVFYLLALPHIGLLAIPPIVTFCAASCSPKSELLLRVFGVYNIFLGFLTMIMIYPLGYLAFLLYFWPVLHWCNTQTP